MWLRVTLPLAAIVAVVAWTAAPALAHVTVHPTVLAADTHDASITFRVPNEEDGASTVAVAVTFPTDHPLLGVLARSVPGWTATVTFGRLPTPVVTDDGTITEAVTSVTWRGGSIPPQGYQDFDVTVGTFTGGHTLALPTVQTYSNGSVVRWTDPTSAGGPEPDHPAPVLVLSSADATAGSSTDASAARTLAIAALAVAALALVLAVIALVRRARPRPATGTGADGPAPVPAPGPDEPPGAGGDRG